ncbi:hypothetical protein C8Q77DRAFT_1058110, partial [Trametes polyzona]
MAALRTARTPENRRAFKRAQRAACAQYYKDRIQEACSKGKHVWDMVSWTKPRALPTYKSLVHNNRPLATLEELWMAANSVYNSAAQRTVDMSFLDEMPEAEERDFPPISRQELCDAVADLSGRSAPGADHLRWPY